MKQILFAIGLSALMSCNNNTEDKKATASMAGAYKMLSQSMKYGKVDTTYTSKQQLKIYTDDFMMYANMNPGDSVAGFGIGSYSVSGDYLIENVMYTASDTSASDSLSHFTLLVEKTAKGYKQVIENMTRDTSKFKLSEEYETVSTAAKSSLDGVWELTKNYTVKGKDTLINKMKQYKIYYGGHFIFGHTYTDSANKIHTGIGFGDFEMHGNNKAEEDVTASTYSSIRGKKFDIDIELNGTDEFKQTLTNDGEKWVEFYKRVKK